MSRSTVPDPVLATALHRARHARGITQESLAFEAELTVSALSQIERGVSDPRWKTLTSVTHALDLSLCDLEMSLRQIGEDGLTVVEIAGAKRRVK